MSHTLIICPLKKELTYLLEGFSKVPWKFHAQSADRLVFFQGIFPQASKVTLAVGGHGKAQFGIQTQYLISHYQDVSKVFCVGAAGAFVESLNIGDLVVAEKTIEHDYKEQFNPSRRLPEFNGDSELLVKALQVSQTISTNYQVHFGPIASGDEDIIDEERASELSEKTKAIAVAWEGSGGARASKFNQIPFLEIRAITDHARGFAVAENFKRNLQVCMHNAADFIRNIIMSTAD